MTTEELKQEAVKKAYGEYFERCKPDEDGWSKSSNLTPGIFEELNMEGFGTYSNGKARPVLLKGIKDNNGWIRIEEDGSNLPEFGEYWVYSEQYKLIGMTSKRNGFLSKIQTHYQPIITPPLPIY